MKRIHVFWCALGIITCAGLCSAQVITTLAGADWQFPSGQLPAINAPLGNTGDLLFDPQGNLVLADLGNLKIFRLLKDGTLSLVAGNGINGYSGDEGPAVNASLGVVGGMAL